MQYIFGPIIILIGIAMMRYTVQITDFTGQIDWAEKYLAHGLAAGTYTLWRIIGLIFAILGAFWLLGFMDIIGNFFINVLHFRV